MFYYIYTWECSHKSYFWVSVFDKKQSWHFILSKPKYIYRWCTWKFIYRGSIANYKKKVKLLSAGFLRDDLLPKTKPLNLRSSDKFLLILTEKKTQQTTQKKRKSASWILKLDRTCGMEGKSGWVSQKAVEYLGTCCSSYFSVCQHFICLKFSS